ncbi:ferredoxin [Mycolicibacterium confluentis]|uniref:Ferredoxin n=1 Tax=Mycolicibacterium confluentis TaxID=28047 RepID=A0A7I7Y387_9MYCO|nr:ferredoxin [Mycolicibacterium confluentis]MCV7318197.1 ferredoxin [Mycolicibacterium confluentis]ORV29536.1 ferredoxin [Mycolicibacterium confluentis]BBZ36107.1 ferredoxin [Mycolicibacterium confluentis]
MKVWVNDGLCRGHGVCVAVCPEVFDLTDGGYAEAIEDDVAPEFHAAVQEAIAACPEHAIEER